MEIKLLRSPIAWTEVSAMAKAQFGDMIKAAVDVERGIMALGGELHADEEAALLEDGSSQENIWGINIYPDKPAAERLEFDSMINVRPSHNNHSRGVEDPSLRARIEGFIERMIRP
ncbi:MAG: DUF5674 family protein [Elusimicrobia bacterium]|nr:DUF5674 family protein [Elusimicrobiota bacterium]